MGIMGPVKLNHVHLHTPYTEDNNCYLNKAACTPAELVEIKKTIPHATEATKDYTSNGAYGTCEITACKAGYKVDQGACAKPNTGHYVDYDGKEVDCTGISIINHGIWTANPNYGSGH